MDNNGTWKPFITSNKINISVQVNPSDLIGSCFNILPLFYQICSDDESISHGGNEERLSF
jgi:hypothetical protein